MDDERRCEQCGQSLKDRRPDAVFCRQKCKRKYYRQAASSNYLDPPSAGTSGVAETRADATFRAQLASHQIASQPLTDEERILLARQKRNPGPMLPELQQRMLAREHERRRAEAEEAARLGPLRVEDQLDPSTRGHVARRAILSRSRQSKPADPDLRALRPEPGRGRYPGDLPEVINGPPRNTPRWMM